MTELAHTPTDDLSEKAVLAGGGAQSYATPASVDDQPISLAEYMHWASIQRQLESRDKTPIRSGGFGPLGQWVLQRREDKTLEASAADSEVAKGDAVSNEALEQLQGLSVRQIELNTARRALRQAGWASVFFLITADILGPYNAPFAVSGVGLVPGVALYTLFGAAATLTGFMIWQMFCQLDSLRFPVRHYGDIAERIFGPWARIVCDILVAVQLLFNCAIVVLSNGQGLSQIVNGKLCFTVCIVIWSFFGMLMGLIRKLHLFSVLANFSVWLNLLIIILSMGFIAHSPPNIAAALATYGASLGSGPVVVQAIRSQSLFSQINAVFNIVFAFGGSMIFPEIIAEMRRPMDFWKGMACAQIFIYSVYLTYGVFVYCFQGQYTLPLAYQGVSKYAWQSIGNGIALYTVSVAAGLYGNIGLKVVYTNIVEGLFKGPPLMSKKGQMIWLPMLVVWWGLAYIIGAGLPGLGSLTGLVGAVAIFQFTYTFPPLMMLGLQVGIDASLADEAFTTPGIAPKRIDNWTQLSRWKRGFFAGGSKRLAYKIFNLFFFIAACATGGLGLWGTGKSLAETLSAGAASSFGCVAPV